MCETSSFTLREGHGFRVFENVVLRRMKEGGRSGKLEKTV
jgi:hypothetical protein